MRVLIVNTSERTGGAAIAAHRLMEALIDNDIKAKMLVRDKETDCLTVATIGAPWYGKWCFLWERVVVWAANGFHRHRLFEVDAAQVGYDITKTPEFKQADILHLNWVNQGLLSLDNLEKIIKSGKPIVWTMHDMWTFTGICHYNGSCEKYRTQCHHCPVLYNGGSKNDLSARTFLRKQKLLSHANIHYVACSNWLAGIAQQSTLLSGHPIDSIPNAINTNLYRPSNKIEARLRCHLPKDKKLILFTAYNTTSVIKGLSYLEEACRRLVAHHPELVNQLGIIAVGKESMLLADRFPFFVYGMNYVSDERKMVNIYNAADLFVIPSLQDNLPNTIVESMACGIPCVGFNTGGIPQMIDHLQNGYVAQYKEADDLAKGILWILTHENYEELSKAACRKARNTYSEQTIAKKYINVYDKITNSENG
ncbi:MAG: glycosyltransferase family 4 protein [Bacteroidaceae bacterium]